MTPVTLCRCVLFVVCRLVDHNVTLSTVIQSSVVVMRDEVAAAHWTAASLGINVVPFRASSAVVTRRTDRRTSRTVRTATYCTTVAGELVSSQQYRLQTATMNVTSVFNVSQTVSKIQLPRPRVQTLTKQPSSTLSDGLAACQLSLQP